MTAWGLAWRTIARSPARSVLAVAGVDGDRRAAVRHAAAVARTARLVPRSARHRRLRRSRGRRRGLAGASRRRSPARRRWRDAIARLPDVQRRRAASAPDRPSQCAAAAIASAPASRSSARSETTPAASGRSSAGSPLPADAPPAQPAAARHQHQARGRAGTRAGIDAVSSASSLPGRASALPARRRAASPASATSQFEAADEYTVATTLRGISAAHGDAGGRRRGAGARRVAARAPDRGRGRRDRDGCGPTCASFSNEQVVDAVQRERVQLLPPDLGRAVVDDARLRVPAGRHAADGVGEPAARRGGGAARARLSAPADRREPAVGIGAAGRRRRRRRAAARRRCSRSCSIASCARCPAFPSGCTSSSSSRARSCCTRRCWRRPASLAAVYPIWLATRLPIAATLRREIVS